MKDSRMIIRQSRHSSRRQLGPVLVAGGRGRAGETDYQGQKLHRV